MFLKLILYDLWNDVFAIVDNLSYRHVELHLPEPLWLLVDPLHNFKFSHDIIILAQRNIFNVDQSLLNRNIVLSSNDQLNLHCLHQNLISFNVIPMELGFLIVHSIQQVFEVRYFWQIRLKIF